MLTHALTGKNRQDKSKIKIVDTYLETNQKYCNLTEIHELENKQTDLSNYKSL